MFREINVLALVKDGERYVFIFDDENRVEILRQLGRFAANPELSFTWYDAAVMSQKIRQTASEDANVNLGNYRPPLLSSGFSRRFSQPLTKRFTQGQNYSAPWEKDSKWDERLDDLFD